MLWKGQSLSALFWTAILFVLYHIGQNHVVLSLDSRKTRKFSTHKSIQIDMYKFSRLYLPATNQTCSVCLPLFSMTHSRAYEEFYQTATLFILAVRLKDITCAKTPRLCQSTFRGIVVVSS